MTSLEKQVLMQQMSMEYNYNTLTSLDATRDFSNTKM